MSELVNSIFLEGRYEEYIDEGFSEEEAKFMAELDLEVAGDALND